MKRIVAFLLSILIMAVIFSRINPAEFQSHLRGLDVTLFITAVLFFIPQIAISAYRWKVMIENKAPMGLWEAAKLNLACNALNILLPSRVGDLSKAYFIGRQGRVEMKRGMNVVFFEKYIDLASLGIVVLTGIFFSRQWDGPSLMGAAFSSVMIGLFPVLYFINLEKWMSFPIFENNKFLGKVRTFFLDTHAYLEEIKKDPKLLFGVVGLSIFLWFLHILQFYVMFRAFHSEVSLFHVFRLIPLAILVGLIPLTIAGMGTRDSAMIYLFSPYESAARVAGIGLFASLRYFVPGILGLPFLNHYIVKPES